jgi:hypothetical protein
MSYYLDLFTPETWSGFRQHGARISGFREHQRKSAERIKPGDIFVCYLVRLSRWFFVNPDPFVLRFEVEAEVILELDRAIPIFEPEIWSRLTVTEGIEVRAMGWAQYANLRASLRQMDDADGALLVDLLQRQNSLQREYPLTAQDKQRLTQKKSIQTIDRAVVVEVPVADDVQPTADESSKELTRESIKMEAMLSRVGAEMGFRIWVPRTDKHRILSEVPHNIHSAFLDSLPLNYDDTTLKTVEQIDVIWLKGRSMSRAFEVEHTTAVYSGILRMADLLALQPNMDIRLHIVAPSEKREKVLREITRPVFSLLERRPLYESCSYLPYEAIREISEMRFLGHMSDSIIEEYEEFAQDE